MDINLGNIGARNNMIDMGIGEVGAKAAGKAGASKQPDTLVIGGGLSALDSAEPVAEVPDSALSRDDALGKLVKSAFNFQPPPMPNFTD